MNKESQNIEFKESWRDEYQKWICGFANAQGGTLYIGISDNGEVLGLQDAYIGYYYDGDKAKVVYHTNISRVYKIVKGKEYKGEEVCYEANSDIDYPYFCPALDENCYECEVERSRNDLKIGDTIQVTDKRGKTYEGVIVGFDNIYVKFLTKELKKLKAKNCIVKKIEKKAPKNLDIVGICVIFAM